MAICLVEQTGLNGFMVVQGLAVAYRCYLHAYVPVEDWAHTAHRGLWAGTCIMPWE